MLNLRLCSCTDLKIAYITTLESLFTIVNCFIRLTSDKLWYILCMMLYSEKFREVIYLSRIYRLKNDSRYRECATVE